MHILNKTETILRLSGQCSRQKQKSHTSLPELESPDYEKTKPDTEVENKYHIIRSNNGVKETTTTFPEFLLRYNGLT